MPKSAVFALTPKRGLKKSMPKSAVFVLTPKRGLKKYMPKSADFDLTPKRGLKKSMPKSATLKRLYRASLCLWTGSPNRLTIYGLNTQLFLENLIVTKDGLNKLPTR